MTETLITNKFNTKDLWQAVAGPWSPNIKIINGTVNLEPDITALVVICPLYAPGNLTKSQLIYPPYGIYDSRVHSKFNAYLGVLENMTKYLDSVGGSLILKAVFANRGVLIKNPVPEDYQALNWHSELLSAAIANFCQRMGITHEYYTQNDFGIDFPTFVDMEESANGIERGEPAELINLLNKLIGVSVVNNRDSRHRVKRVMEIDGVGFTGAFWMIAGYLAFDTMISELISPNGIYLSAEKAHSLFGVAHLTESLEIIPRIEIEA